MSCMRCDSCGTIIDTDYNVEAIVTWEPCTCETCFEGMERYEVWNLALEAVKFELSPALREQLGPMLKGMMK